MNCPNCNDEMQKLESGSFSHSNNSCPLAYRPWSAYEVKIIGDTIAAAQKDNPWKAALEQAAIVSWTLTATNKDDPEKMLADLWAQARREALDPAVSEDAAKLVAAARSQALQEAAQRQEEAQIKILSMSSDFLRDANPTIGYRLRDIANLLAAQPAAAPACPNCGVTGQVSGPGTATLCLACGEVMG